MKLTRKHLNYILVNLPDPIFAHEGRIAPYLEVPITEPNYLLKDALLPDYHKPIIKTLRFSYSKRDMDWVLEDFEI